jgi:hypothetical protein
MTRKQFLKLAKYFYGSEDPMGCRIDSAVGPLYVVDLDENKFEFVIAGRGPLGCRAVKLRDVCMYEEVDFVDGQDILAAADEMDEDN